MGLGVDMLFYPEFLLFRVKISPALYTQILISLLVRLLNWITDVRQDNYQIFQRLTVSRFTRDTVSVDYARIVSLDYCSCAEFPLIHQNTVVQAMRSSSYSQWCHPQARWFSDASESSHGRAPRNIHCPSCVFPLIKLSLFLSPMFS
jgi:hypothetical protein